MSKLLFKILMMALIIILVIGCIMLNSVPAQEPLIEIDDYPVAIW